MTKRISCREWCKKNNVPIESLVVNRGKDDDKYFFIEQESFEKSPFHYALRICMKPIIKDSSRAMKKRKEEEKKDNRKAIIDEMNKAMQHELESCFGEIQ